MSKAKNTKAKVGSFVRIKEKSYRHIWYEGVITESFDDFIQIYGVGSRDQIGYHEIETKEAQISPMEKERIRFVFDQSARKIKEQKIRAEIKFKETEDLLNEVESKITKYFL